MTLEPQKPILLLVEGEDDKAFFEALIEDMALEDVQVEQLNGKDRWRDKVKNIKELEEFGKYVKSLGLVRDADTNAVAAFQSVDDALNFAGLSRPTKPLDSVGSDPMVTVLILPDENEEGELEDLCLKSVESNPAMNCVNAYFECLEQTGLVALPSKLSKPKVQAFLASKGGKVIGIRRASKWGCWKWDNTVFDKVKQFIRQISEIS
jgi:hypothetical protein